MDFFKAVNETLKAPEPAPKVTAAVIAPAPPPEAPYVEPPMPYGPPGPLDIPLFLMRREGGGWMYPSLHPPLSPEHRGLVDTATAAADDPRERHLYNWSDARLNAALEDTSISCVARQPIYAEAHRRHELVRTRDRFAKLKENL